MPDITMCRGKTEEIECQRKDSCYRYTAIPSEYQSFFSVPPIIVDSYQVQQCAYYSKNI